MNPRTDDQYFTIFWVCQLTLRSVVFAIIFVRWHGVFSVVIVRLCLVSIGKTVLFTGQSILTQKYVYLARIELPMLGSISGKIVFICRATLCHYHFFSRLVTQKWGMAEKKLTLTRLWLAMVSVRSCWEVAGVFPMPITSGPQWARHSENWAFTCTDHITANLHPTDCTHHAC